MNKNFKRYEAIVCFLFLFSCIFDISLRYLFIFIILLVCIVIFTAKAIWSLNFSKTKKVLFIIAQLICCFILYVIWFLIWLATFTDGIRFGE